MERPSLKGCDAKLGWAFRHLELLEAELANAPDYADSISFAQEFNPDASTIEVTFRGIPELPPEWGLIAADFLQNARAALNYLAWELSRLNLGQRGKSRGPKKATQFPINTVAGEFDAHKLPDVDPEHVAVIRELQPSSIEVYVPPMYRDLPEGVPLPESLFMKRDQAIAAHPLTHLAKLTNDDKHRTLPVALLGSWEGRMTAMPTSHNCKVGIVNWGHIHPHLENGAHWGTVEVIFTGLGKPELEVNSNISRADPCIGACRIADFSAIAACVEGIIARFEPAFD